MQGNLYLWSRSGSGSGSVLPLQVDPPGKALPCPTAPILPQANEELYLSERSSRGLLQDAEEVGHQPRRVDLGAPTRRISEALDCLPFEEVHRTVLKWSPSQELMDLLGLGIDVPLPQARA